MYSIYYISSENTTQLFDVYETRDKALEWLDKIRLDGYDAWLEMLSSAC